MINPQTVTNRDEWVEKKSAPNQVFSNILDLVKQNRTPEAANLMNEYERRGMNRGAFLQNLIQYAKQEKRLIEVIQLLTAILEIHSLDSEVHFLLALVLMELGWLAEAERQFDNALKLSPHNGAIWDYRGRVKAGLKKWEDVEQSLLQLRRLSPQRIPSLLDFLTQLGYHYHTNAHAGPATLLYHLVLKYNPGHPRALWGAACQLIRESEYLEAEKLIQRVIEIRGERPNYLEGMAIVYKQTHRLEEAEQCYLRVLDAFPDCPDTLCGLAEIYQIHGKFDQAQTVLNKALAIEPDNYRATFGLGNCYLAAQDFEQARKYYREAEKQKPFDMSLALNIGRLYLQQKDLEKGIHYLWRSASIPEYNLSTDDIFDRIFNRLDRLIPAEYQGQKNVIWVMCRASAYAHVITESFYMQNLHHDYDHLFILGPPVKKYDQMCSGVFNLSTRDFHYIETEDHLFLNLNSIEMGRYHRGNTTYCFNTFEVLSHDYFQMAFNDSPLPARRRRYFHLSKEEENVGEKIALSAGIPENASTVVLHIRENGFHQIQKQAFRNITVSNYHQAIQFLVDQGYYVIRLGDPTVTPLADFGPQVIDAPFLPEYHPYFDPYIIDRSEFMITCHSGPCALARALAKPCLVINGIYSVHHIPEAFELLSYKKYYALEDGQKRLIGYEEIMDRQLYLLRETQEFEQEGVILEEMTSDEILKVTEEMVRMLTMETVPDSPYQTRFKALTGKENHLLQTDPTKKAPFGRYFGCALDSARISDVYSQMNPSFLG